MLRRLAERIGVRRPVAAVSAGGELSTVSFPKFHDCLPSQQAALDLFKGRWTISLPEVDGRTLVAGPNPYFTADPRPHQAIRAFGGPNGRIDGFKVLELGPLEGGHAYTLEHY